MKQSFVNKSIVVLSLTTLLGTTQAGMAVALTASLAGTENQVKVKVDDKMVTFPDAKAFLDLKSNRTMVPVRFVSEALGAKVDWEAATQTVKVTQGTKHISLHIGNNVVETDGKPIYLDAKPTIKDARTFVPLRFVSEALEATVDWNGTENLVTITTKSTDDSQTATTPSSSNEKKLTKESAIEQALVGNSELKQLRLDVDTADMNARLVHAQVKDIPADFVTTLSAAQQKYVSDVQAQTKAKVNALYIKSTENQIKLGAQKKFYDYSHAQADLEMKSQSLHRAEEQLRIAKVSFEAGARAKTDGLQAEAGVAGAQAAQANAKSQLELARLKMNEFIGADLNKQWTLLADNSLVKKQPMQLEEAVDLATKQRAEVLQKQEEVKIAELNLQLIEKYSSLATYQGMMSKNDVEKAKMAVDKAIQLVSVEVTQAYYNLQSAEAGITAYQKAKDAAKENYRLSKLRYENGLATTLEIIQAEEELSNRENQYEQALHNYNLAFVSYENAAGN